MIRRVVKMTFQTDKVDTFSTLFEATKQRIRNFPGCRHLELWQHHHQKNVFFTFSHWDSEEALNNYRHSDLFRTTWSQTKILFAEKPEAWSVDKVSTTQEEA
jgi:quinol monooxygenase YgiN